MWHGFLVALCCRAANGGFVWALRRAVDKASARARENFISPHDAGGDLDAYCAQLGTMNITNS